MDKYCRTCMRDSNLFSQIFDEMIYGDIAFQEAIQDVCQLEVSIRDDLPAYICRDCALKLYDFVKFKMDAHEVDCAMRKLLVSDTPIGLPCESFTNPAAGSIDNEPCEADHVTGNNSREIKSFEDCVKPAMEATVDEDFFAVETEEEIQILILEDGDTYQEIVESVSDAPGCFSGEIRTHSEAEYIGESCNDQSELNTSIPKDSVAERSVDMRNVQGRVGHSKQNECSGEDTVDNEESVVHFINGYKLRVWKKERICKDMDDQEENLPNCHKGSLGQDNCVDAFPGNLKKRNTAKKAIPKTDSMESKKGNKLKEESKKIKSPSNGSKTANSKEKILVKHFYCDFCKKGFQDKLSLGYHVRVHSEGKPLKCSICDESFKSKSELDSHKVVHSNGGCYACNQCDKTFKKEVYLKRHMETHNCKHICEVCGKIFALKSSLTYHMKHHGNYDKFPCVTCGRSFKCEIDLQKHLESHGAVYRYHCKICGKGFPLKECHRAHLLTHTDRKTYFCNVCGKTLKRKNSLKEHIERHEGLKHKCVVCGKDFTLLFSLRRHMLIHSKLKTHCCPNCSKVFSRLSYLKDHLKFFCRERCEPH